MSVEPPIASSRPESHKIRGFRHHLIAYVLVIVLLLALNLATGGPYWVLWVVAGWGIGVLAHGFFVLRPRPRPDYSVLGR